MVSQEEEDYKSISFACAEAARTACHSAHAEHTAYSEAAAGPQR